MFPDNITVKGLENPNATVVTFAGGWLPLSDPAVIQRDGCVKTTDRSKDIFLSGGENISSLEVGDTVMAVAVVSRPAAKGAKLPAHSWD
jgi:3-(methylthio)propionyl---CoA ligase